MRWIPPVLGGKEPGCCLARTLRNILLFGDHPAQGIRVPGHGESVLKPGDRKRCPMTATVQGQAHDAFDGEAVLGEAGHFEVGGNLAHGPFKKRQQGKSAMG
jgi:hypothetical protein